MWYVIHTLTGKELNCKQQCEKYVDRASYAKIFIPQYITKKHFKQEWHEVKKTLFPGYVFVDTETIEPVIEGIRQFGQYTRVLQDGETVSPIRESEEKFLSDMMDEEYVVHYSEGFLIGEEVCILSGPLRNYKGCIRTVDRHRRVAKLEISVFGGMTPVEVGFGAIARVSREEFRKMKEESIRRQSKTTPDDFPSDVKAGDVPEEAQRIRVLAGVFAGMEGKLLWDNARNGECTVELKLFDTGTKAVFRRDEIEFI